MSDSSAFDSVCFVTEGGIGKNIMATAMVRAISKQYPDKPLIVVASHPDVFLNNPRVHRVFNFNNPLNLYDDYFVKGRTKVFHTEPYRDHRFVAKTHHLIDIWCHQLGVSFDGIEPELYLTADEIRMGKIFLQDANGRPILLIQSHGGLIPQEDNDLSRLNAERIMQRRSIPHDIAQEVVNAIGPKYQILHLRAPTQAQLSGTKSTHSTSGVRSIIALIPYIDKFLLIDSFMQHACAAFKKQAVVVWGGTSPTTLGYPTHINLEHNVCANPHCQRPNSFLWDIRMNGQNWDCPYANPNEIGEPCLRLAPDDILKALNITREATPCNKCVVPINENSIDPSSKNVTFQLI